MGFFKKVINKAVNSFNEYTDDVMVFVNEYNDMTELQLMQEYNFLLNNNVSQKFKKLNAIYYILFQRDIDKELFRKRAEEIKRRSY